MKKYKPLVLPKFQFAAIAPVLAPNPIGGPNQTLPAFTMAAKDWKGVPPQSVQAPKTPAAWTLDQLAFSTWNYDAVSFPTTADYIAANVAFMPALPWGQKDTIIYKPKTVYLHGLLTLAQAVALLAPIAAKLAEKKIVVDIRGSTTAHESAPFSLVSLPMSGWTGVKDTYMGGGIPTDEAHFPSTTTPAEWTAGETLHFCTTGYLETAGGYIPPGDIGARLAVFMAAEASRVTADFGRYDKLGIVLVTSYAISAQALMATGAVGKVADAFADPAHGVHPDELAASAPVPGDAAALDAAIVAYNAIDPGNLPALLSGANAVLSAATTLNASATNWQTIYEGPPDFGVGDSLDVLMGLVVSFAGTAITQATGNVTAATDGLARLADFTVHISEMLAAVAVASPVATALYHGDPTISNPFPPSLLPAIVTNDIIPKIVSFFEL